jgi:hypothetical protein|nr:MAG TPA: hypothetical protein [Herelleviridae sp.]
MNLFSAINNARTPMTTDEKSAIKRSARMGVYVVLRVIGLVSWVLVSMWIMLWGALKVVPNMGRLVQDVLGVTSTNAPSTEVFIAYWVAPMLLITIVIAAGVIWLCALGHRGLGKVFAVLRRWVDRAAFESVTRDEATSDATIGGRIGHAKKSTQKVEKTEKKSRKH